MTHWYVKRYCTENYVSKVSVWPTSRFWDGKGREIGMSREGTAYREMARLDLSPNLGRKLQEHAVPPGCSAASYSLLLERRKDYRQHPFPIPVDSTYEAWITRWTPISVCDPDRIHPVHVSDLSLTNSSWCPEILPASTGKIRWDGINVFCHIHHSNPESIEKRVEQSRTVILSQSFDVGRCSTSGS